MFNLSEILTLIIGILLAIIFLDGLRRALRSRRNSIMVDLSSYPNEEFEDLNNDPISNDLYEAKNSEVFSSESLDDSEDFIDSESHELIILNLTSTDLECFSFNSLSGKLSKFSCIFEEQGFFVFKDQNKEDIFSLINAKKPGTFLGDSSTPDIALVLDPQKVTNVVESFDFMFSVVDSLSHEFPCKLLDENRNPLTKQMLDHMRNKALEFHRLNLSRVG